MWNEIASIRVVDGWGRMNLRVQYEITSVIKQPERSLFRESIGEAPHILPFGSRRNDFGQSTIPDSIGNRLQYQIGCTNRTLHSLVEGMHGSKQNVLCPVHPSIVIINQKSDQRHRADHHEHGNGKQYMVIRWNWTQRLAPKLFAT